MSFEEYMIDHYIKCWDLAWKVAIETHDYNDIRQQIAIATFDKMASPSYYLEQQYTKEKTVQSHPRDTPKTPLELPSDIMTQVQVREYPDHIEVHLTEVLSNAHYKILDEIMRSLKGRYHAENGKRWFNIKKERS